MAETQETGRVGFLHKHPREKQTIETKVKSEEGGLLGNVAREGGEDCSSVLVATLSDPVLRSCWSIETVESSVLHPSPKGHPDPHGFLVFWKKPPPPWEPGTVCLVPFVSPNHVAESMPIASALHENFSRSALSVVTFLS